MTRRTSFSERLERAAPAVFLLPAVLIVLVLSIFPLITSLWLSLSRVRFANGAPVLDFVGLDNFRKFLVGVDQGVLVGKMDTPAPLGWVMLALAVAISAWFIWRGLSQGPMAVLGRVINAALMLVLVWLTATTVWSIDGRPGTIVVTLMYVVVGVTLQYLLGLGLALLCTQQLRGRRFFRIVFLLPMMITPVGVGYLWRMLADTHKGPFVPMWSALGLAEWAWANQGWSARMAVIVGDIWQWTPFMFIVLVAALEAQSIEPLEAALVDGANSRQIFWNITMPAILPVSASLILIRLIEAFKIVDLPTILTNGGPGTATETITTYAYKVWRAPDIGGSAALAYILLFLVTVVATFFANAARSRLSDQS